MAFILFESFFELKAFLNAMYLRMNLIFYLGIFIGADENSNVFFLAKPIYELLAIIIILISKL
jgi:hypothetical protein